MKVLILFGGESSEHEVSILSAKNIYNAISKKKYEVSLGFIGRNGQLFKVSLVQLYEKTDDLDKLIPMLGDGKFITTSGDEIAPDVIFPVLHGENSEDGAIAALAKLMHIPVVGCDMYAGALCMDKLSTKRVLEQVGIKTAPFLVHSKGDKIDYNKVTDTLGSVLFIKPTKAGSSVGVSKTSSKTEFETALELAHEYDDTVLIETAVPNAREIEISVLGNDDIEISVPGEIVPDREFYDYESKYSDDSSSEAIIPADLPEKTSVSIRQIAARAYHELGCSGLSRVDFLYGDDGQIIFNEINTMPGFTNISMYPKLWEHMGLNQADLIEKLIDLAIKKGA